MMQSMVCMLLENISFVPVTGQRHYIHCTVAVRACAPPAGYESTGQPLGGLAMTQNDVDIDSSSEALDELVYYTYINMCS